MSTDRIVCALHETMEGKIDSILEMTTSTYNYVFGKNGEPGLKDSLYQLKRVTLGSECEDEIGLVRRQKGNKRAIDDLKVVLQKHMDEVVTVKNGLPRILKFIGGSVVLIVVTVALTIVSLMKLGVIK